MKKTTAETHSAVLCAALALGGCADDRLRELGYTLAQQDTPEGARPIEAECNPAFLGADAVIRAVAADLAAQPGEDRPFLRYASLADRIDVQACPSELESRQAGLAKLMNSLSREPVVVAPSVVGQELSLLRLDLRDYGWTREVNVNGQSYSDAWEALIDNSPFAVELTGTRATAISEQTGTSVPVLSADALIGAASDSALYYALLGVPATLAEIRESVGLPGVLDPLENGAQRAATQRSRVLRSTGNLRVVDRYAIDGSTGGTYWEASQIGTGTFIADPLHAQPDVQRLIIFSLPNDLLAFAVTDAAGVRQGPAELVLDTNRDDFVASVVASCTNCHATGLIPLVDEAGPAILANPDLFGAEVVSAYEDAPTEEERLAQFEEDSSFYAQALGRAGVPTQGQDPISRVAIQFNVEVDLKRAAGDLLVTPETLRARLGELAPELRPLGLGLLLSRQQFGAQYAGAYCVLHATDENPPAVCD